MDDKDRLVKGLQEAFEKTKLDLDPRHLKTIENWEEKRNYTVTSSIFLNFVTRN